MKVNETKVNGSLLPFTGFKPPDPATRALAAKKFEEGRAEEARNARAARLKNSDIPKRYRSASLNGCPQTVRDWVDNFGAGTNNGLVFHGSVGTGKTYAACAVLVALADRFSVRFTTGSDMLRAIRSTYSGSVEREDDVVRSYLSQHILVIDDIGKEQATDWALSQLFSIVDSRYRQGHPTIFTCQTAGDGLIRSLSVHGDSQTAEAIVDRMRDCVSVKFSGQSRRGHR